MNSFTQLVQHVKNANWSGANQVFAEIMQQKVADRLASERQTIFTEATAKMAECLNCGTIFPVKRDVWSEQCPSCHSRGEANIAPVYKVKDAVQSLKKHGLHEDDTKYQEYFRSQLKKHGYDSPADIPDDKKDDFFNAVDKGYKAKNESVERLTEANDEDVKTKWMAEYLMALVLDDYSRNRKGGHGDSSKIKNLEKEAIKNYGEKWRATARTVLDNLWDVMENGGFHGDERVLPEVFLRTARCKSVFGPKFQSLGANFNKFVKLYDSLSR